MRAAALLVLAAASLAIAPAAAAQPQVGIVRPSTEAGKSRLELGAELFAGNCSSCHGSGGQGVPRERAQPGSGELKGYGPSLRGVGALAADFYLRTGYMPLKAADAQPQRGRVLFNEREIRALIAYVASLGGGPPVPRPRPAEGSLSEGLELFTEHCAGCHQVVAKGGVVTGARVPPLEDATPRQVAEAVRIGPYVMPSFSKRDLTDAQLDSIVRYVEYAKHPEDRGGWGIGNVGPIPEGMVTWFIAALAFVMACMLIGERVRS
jgi:ubiquinol-cytochrome c reductase cytochrome c subunit